MWRITYSLFNGIIGNMTEIFLVSSSVWRRKCFCQSNGEGIDDFVNLVMKEVLNLVNATSKKTFISRFVSNKWKDLLTFINLTMMDTFYLWQTAGETNC